MKKIYTAYVAFKYNGTITLAYNDLEMDDHKVYLDIPYIDFGFDIEPGDFIDVYEEEDSKIYYKLNTEIFDEMLKNIHLFKFDKEDS